MAWSITCHVPSLPRRWLIVAALFVVTFGISMPLAAYGVFLPIIAETFGWSRGALSGAFALYAFGYSGLSVVSGHLTDRWGPRAVISIGGVFLGADEQLFAAPFGDRGARGKLDGEPGVGQNEHVAAAGNAVLTVP